MIINILKKDNLELVQIDEFYTKSELKQVNKEVKELYKFRKSSESTKSATDDNNNLKKSGTGIFLYGLYNDQAKESPIIRYNKKIFTHKYLQYLISTNINYRHIQNCNRDDILLNYYTKTQEYKAHYDTAIYTIIIMVKIGDFTGGELVFDDIGKQIDFKENRAIIFPGCATHQAKPIYGDGIRATIAQFINYK